MEVDKSIEATILDYIRFFPEEVQSDYAAMLQRCNFHDATDPCFPIMLFLLFFQESICEKTEQLDFSIQTVREELCKKQSFAASGTVQSHKWLKISMILLTVINLTISGSWIAYNALADRFPKTEQVHEKKEQNQLQEMNRYWLKKLEADEHAQVVVQSRNCLNSIAIGLGGAIVLSLLFCAIFMRKTKRYEAPVSVSGKSDSASRKKRIFQLFSRIAVKTNSSITQEKEEEMKRNRKMKRAALLKNTQDHAAEEKNTQQSATAETPQQPKQETVPAVKTEAEPPPNPENTAPQAKENNPTEAKTAAKEETAAVQAEKTEKPETLAQSLPNGKSAADQEIEGENSSLFLQIVSAVLKTIQKRLRQKKEAKASPEKTELKLAHPEDEVSICVASSIHTSKH